MARKRLRPLDYFAALMLFGIVAVITGQVIWRYVFNDSLSWSEELSRYLFAWLIFVGASIAVKENTHIRVDVIFNYLNAARRRQLDVLLHVLTLFVQLYFFYYAVQFIIKTHGTYSTAMGVQMNLFVYPSIAVGCVVTIVYCLLGIRQALRRPTGEDAKE